MEFFDVVIIGAGPAGSVASAYLQKQHKSVLVLEKEVFPRFVIGESLLPNCMNHLEEVNLLDAVKEAEFQIKSGAIFYKGEDKCAFEFSDKFTDGWDWTWQVKRADFDKILIDQVIDRGVDVRFNSEVTSVSCSTNKQLITYKSLDGKLNNIESKFVIDASGYGRVLPRMFNLNVPSKLVPRGAVFTHVNDKNRTSKEGNNIFVHAFNNNRAWFWAIPFSDGTTSVGVVGENSFINELSQNDSEKFKNFISSFKALNNRFKDVDLLFDPQNIIGYSISVKKMFGDGYVLCGNSTEFLDPIFSSGVTLATASGLQAAKLVSKQLKGEVVNWKDDYEEVIKEGVEVFRSYVNAWYNGDLHTIIFADTIKPEFKQQICSVLAGYVWDANNPFSKKHKTILKTLAKVIKLNQKN